VETRQCLDGLPHPPIAHTAANHRLHPLPPSCFGFCFSSTNVGFSFLLSQKKKKEEEEGGGGGEKMKMKMKK